LLTGRYACFDLTVKPCTASDQEAAMFTAIEIHSGEAVTREGSCDPVLFVAEQGAWDYLLDRFGSEAGREYDVRDVEGV
jgi:hypothetical protein